MAIKLLRLDENYLGANPSQEMNIDETILDALVDAVGSEKDIELAAELAFDDLTKSFENGEIEMKEGDIPEKLAVASLIVKLVELGKLGPTEADEIIATHLD
jgi:hypothetical protein